MSITDAEYKRAKEDLNQFKEWSDLCEARIFNLVDQLTQERENQLAYKEGARKNREIIARYEIEQEVLEKGEK